MNVQVRRCNVELHPHHWYNLQISQFTEKSPHFFWVKFSNCEKFVENQKLSSHLSPKLIDQQLYLNHLQSMIVLWKNHAVDLR